MNIISTMYHAPISIMQWPAGRVRTYTYTYTYVYTCTAPQCNGPGRQAGRACFPDIPDIPDPRAACACRGLVSPHPHTATVARCVTSVKNGAGDLVGLCGSSGSHVRRGAETCQ